MNGHAAAGSANIVAKADFRVAPDLSLAASSSKLINYFINLS